MLNDDSTCGSAREFARQSHALEGVGDVVAPGARADDAFAKAIRLPELKADFLRRLLEARAARALGPQILYAQLLFAQVLCAARKAFEDARVALLRVVDALRSLCGATDPTET